MSEKLQCPACDGTGQIVHTSGQPDVIGTCIDLCRLCKGSGGLVIDASVVETTSAGSPKAKGITAERSSVRAAGEESLSAAELDEIEARCNAATPGPWENITRHGSSSVAGGPVRQFARGEGRQQIVSLVGQDWMRDGEMNDNAAFIAAARTDVPRLIAAVRERDAQLAELRKDFNEVLEQRDADIDTACEVATKETRAQLAAERDAAEEAIDDSNRLIDSITLERDVAQSELDEARAQLAEAQRVIDLADTLISMTFDLDNENPWKRAEQKAAWERYKAARIGGANGKT